MKVIMILPDGMRPDSLANIEKAQKIIKESSYSLDAETVSPSVTLPCHISLFHSVTPARHGTTTNTYMPQVRPVDGLCEVLKKVDKKCFSLFEKKKCSGNSYEFWANKANKYITVPISSHGPFSRGRLRRCALLRCGSSSPAGTPLQRVPALMRIRCKRSQKEKGKKQGNIKP